MLVLSTGTDGDALAEPSEALLQNLDEDALSSCESLCSQYLLNVADLWELSRRHGHFRA